MLAPRCNDALFESSSALDVNDGAGNLVQLLVYRKALIIFAALLLAFAAQVAHSAANETVSSYRLGAGDLITIQVLGEPDLKRESVRLSDAGTLSFPILGELKVLGITVAELERLIANGLKARQYLVDPTVTVTIQEYRKFYITGQVGKPGPYAYEPGLNVRKAVTLAGGFRERADQNKIFVVREDDPAQTSRRVTLSTPVNPGDILTVEESFF